MCIYIYVIEGFNSKIIKEKLCSPHPPELSGKKKSIPLVLAQY